MHLFDNHIHMENPFVSEMKSILHFIAIIFILSWISWFGWNHIAPTF